MVKPPVVTGIDKFLFIVILFLFVCSPATAAEEPVKEKEPAAEKYLCVAEHATGFIYNETSAKWEPTVFNSDQKYIVSKPKDEKFSFIVTIAGMDTSWCDCIDGFDEWGYLFCRSGSGFFRFNKRNNRFLYGSLFGYYNVLDEANKITDAKSDTPYILMGQCSPI